MASVGRQLGELIARDGDSLIRVLRRDAAAHVFSEGHSDRHHLVAVFVAGHIRCGRRTRVVTLGRGSYSRVTPRSAQQGDILPSGQRNDDRKQGCSKHVMLAERTGQELGQPMRGRNPIILKVR